MIAADAVNRPGEFMLAKKAVAARATVLASALADTETPLKDLLTSSVPA